MKEKPLKNKPKENEKSQYELYDKNKSIFTPADIYYPYNILKPKSTFREEYDFTYSRAKPVKYVTPDNTSFIPAHVAIQIQDLYHMDDFNNNFRPPDPFYDPNKRRNVNKPKELWPNLFQPKSAILDIRSKLTELLKENDRLFQPNINPSAKYNVSVKVYQQPINSPIPRNSISPILSPKSTKQVTFLKPKDIYTQTHDRETYNLLLTNDSKIHILTKDPIPYEAVIFRFPHQVSQAYAQRSKAKQSKTITQLNLEQLLEEMSKGSEITRNTQRSTNKRLDIPMEGQFVGPCLVDFVVICRLLCSLLLYLLSSVP